MVVTGAEVVAALNVLTRLLKGIFNKFEYLSAQFDHMKRTLQQTQTFHSLLLKCVSGMYLDDVGQSVVGDASSNCEELEALIQKILSSRVSWIRNMTVGNRIKELTTSLENSKSTFNTLLLSRNSASSGNSSDESAGAVVGAVGCVAAVALLANPAGLVGFGVYSAAAALGSIWGANKVKFK